MTIYERIQEERKNPLRDRALLGLIMSEICKDGKPLPDCKAIEKILQMKKTSLKNIELYKDNLVKYQEEGDFIFLLDMFLPEPVTLEEIECFFNELDIEKSMKSMPILMKALKEKYEIVDGNLVKSFLKGE